MTNLSWQPKLELGISTLDNQYKSLYDILQKLDDIIAYRDTSQIEGISEQIKQICIRIYNYERPLLNMVNNNSAKKQIVEYRAFFDRIDRFNLEIATGDKLTAARKLLFEVKSWLNSHLTQLDEHISDNIALDSSKQNNTEIGLKRFSGLFSVISNKFS